MIADVELARMLIESARYPTRATVDIRMLVKALRKEHARVNELAHKYGATTVAAACEHEHVADDARWCPDCGALGDGSGGWTLPGETRVTQLERALAALHSSDKMIDDAVFAAIGPHNLIMAQAVRVVCERMQAAEQALVVARAVEVEHVEGLNILAHEPGGEWHKRVAGRSLARAAEVRLKHSDTPKENE